ncbi:hypothetical protein ABFS83_10G145400 [Erythranthe nasuta]
MSKNKMWLISHKFLFCLFLMTSTLLILSRLLTLRSTGGPYSLDSITFSSSNILTMAETENLDSSCYTNNQILKVFMYDLPPQFHFGLLGWKGAGPTVWPDIRSQQVPEYAGGLNLQHSIEYWLTLDLLNSEFSKNLSGRTAIRVHNSSEADVIFVPFFASISYNRYSKVKTRGSKKSINDLLQENLVSFLSAQEEWKKSGGKDHIVVAHHPNSLLYARMKLWPAIYILADFGRYPPTVANVEKDVIAPYKHLITSYVDDKSDFDSRKTLLHFQGSIYRKDGGIIRQELYYMLKNEKDVHFSFGSIQGDGISTASKGMHSSKFCLNIAGDTPSSNRLFDAIASHCVPVIISDDIELPFEDIINYSEFCIFVPSSDAVREDFLINLIRNISKEKWTRMWEKLKEVEHFFEFHYPSQENDAVQMIWRAILRKVPSIDRKIHKLGRFSRGVVSGESGLRSVSVPRNFW